jgi:hypothetical protein
MAHKGENEFGGDRTGPSFITEEAPLPPPPRKPKKKKKKGTTNKRGGGMVGSSKIIKGYKKGGQV